MTNITERLLACSVPAGQAGRLDKAFLAALSPEEASSVSRETIKKAIQQGFCRVNGTVVTNAATKVYAGNSLELQLPSVSAEPQAEEGELDIIYKDSELLVVNKPAGLTVHPCPSCPEGTLVNRLLHTAPELKHLEGLRPGIVHRLDKDTSGLLAVALTESERLRLTEAFAERAVAKSYLALVHGVPELQGTIDLPLARDPKSKIRMAVVDYGKPALTDWERLWADPAGRFSLLAVRIHTGRTHQIRVHMAHLGYPLVGDALYARTTASPPASSAAHRNSYTVPRQMLHAARLVLPARTTVKNETSESATNAVRNHSNAALVTMTHNPESSASNTELTFACPMPDDMQRAARELFWQSQRVVVTGACGSGKSAATTFLATQGAPVWSADSEVAKLYQPGGELSTVFAQRYGTAFVDPDSGAIDKSALAESMRQDPDLRHEVEKLVHPLLRANLEHFWTSNEAAGVPRTVAEIPLWFESGWVEPQFYTVTLGVSCPGPLRHARLKERRGWSPERIAAVDAWQWPEAEKIRRCTFVVRNDGTLRDLEIQLSIALVGLNTHAKARMAQFSKDWQAVLDTYFGRCFP